MFKVGDKVTVRGQVMSLGYSLVAVVSPVSSGLQATDTNVAIYTLGGGQSLLSGIYLEEALTLYEEPKKKYEMVFTVEANSPMEAKVAFAKVSWRSAEPRLVN